MGGTAFLLTSSGGTGTDIKGADLGGTSCKKINKMISVKAFLVLISLSLSNVLAATCKQANIGSSCDTAAAQACTSTSKCKSNAKCLTDGDKKICVKVDVALGGECNRANRFCNPDSDLVCSSNRCVKVVPKGSPCGSSFYRMCEKNHLCHNGYCYQESAVGGSCKGPYELCAKDSICNPWKNNVCVSCPSGKICPLT